MATLTRTLTQNYDTSSGDTTFDIDLDLSKYKTLNIQFNVTNLSKANSSVALGRSNDESRFTAIPGASVNLPTGVDQAIDINVADFGAKKLSVDFTEAGGGMTGTVESIVITAKTE